MKGRLTRSRNSMVGGVAAGVAEWIGADPAMVRIAWALLVPLTSGAALLAYIVAWVVIPEAADDRGTATVVDPAAPSAVKTAAEPRRDEGRASLVIGAGLVLVGLWFLARELLPRIDWSFIWPLVLVGVGILIVVSARRR